MARATGNPTRNQLDFFAEAAAVRAAREAQADLEEGLRGQEMTVGFLGRVFTQTSLPYRNPGNARVWDRRNGNLVLTVTPGVRVDRDGAIHELGYPYGMLPRLLLAWMTTQAVRTGERELYLGTSMRKFMAELGMKPTGGKNGTITRLRDQATRLFEAGISFRWEGDDDRERGGKFTIASTWDLAPATSFDDSGIVLSRDFFDEITTRPVPLDMRAVSALRARGGSPLRLDLYFWLTYRFSYLTRLTKIPWSSLREQFGFQLAEGKQGDHQFRETITQKLREVLQVYPEANVEVTKAGLELRPSPTHVPFRGLRGLRNSE